MVARAAASCGLSGPTTRSVAGASLGECVVAGGGGGVSFRVQPAPARETVMLTATSANRVIEALLLTRRRIALTPDIMPACWTGAADHDRLMSRRGPPLRSLQAKGRGGYSFGSPGLAHFLR